MAEADKIATGERVGVRPTDALLVIDVQPTFMSGGGLAVPDGDLVLPVIRRLMLLFSRQRRIATKDRHPRGHISLASSYQGAKPYETIIEYERRGNVVLAPHAKFSVLDFDRYTGAVDTQVLWPDHAIAGTDEAELHPALVDDPLPLPPPEVVFGYVLVKGTDPCEDSYSGFKGNAGTPTELADVLRDRGITRIFVCGLALDYCVRFTAEDGKAAGFEVVVIEDATRAVGFPKGSVEATKRSFAEKGIRLIGSEDIFAAR